MTLGPGCGVAVNNFFRVQTHAAIDAILELPGLIEDRGFDSVWLGDHVLFHQPIVDATVLLPAFATATERISIGTGVFLLGLRQPGIAAKYFTSLNALADGRLVIGVGAGGEHPPEFAFAGVDHADRGRLLDDALTELVAQWDGDSEVLPRGTTPPTIVVGGRSNASRRRILRFDAGWLGAWVSPRRIAQESAILREQAGRPVPVSLNVYVRTEDSAATARSGAAEFLGGFYNMAPEPLMRYSVAGTPAECVEQLLEYADAGVQHFVLRPATTDQRGQVERWSEEILPALRPR